VFHTGGQAILSINGRGLEPIVDPTSVSPGDIVPFEVRGPKHYLLVKELRNFIIGDDFGVFGISTTRPLAQDPASVQRTWNRQAMPSLSPRPAARPSRHPV